MSSIRQRRKRVDKLKSNKLKRELNATNKVSLNRPLKVKPNRDEQGNPNPMEQDNPNQVELGNLVGHKADPRSHSAKVKLVVEFRASASALRLSAIRRPASTRSPTPPLIKRSRAPVRRSASSDSNLGEVDLVSNGSKTRSVRSWRALSSLSRPHPRPVKSRVNSRVDSAPLVKVEITRQRRLRSLRQVSGGGALYARTSLKR